MRLSSMQSDGRARIKERGELGVMGRGKRAGHGSMNTIYTQGPLKDLCNRINCTCHVASVITLLKISTFLEVNHAETSVMCCIHI